jgi:hypothetical protein
MTEGTTGFPHWKDSGMGSCVDGFLAQVLESYLDDQAAIYISCHLGTHTRPYPKLYSLNFLLIDKRLVFSMH